MTDTVPTDVQALAEARSAARAAADWAEADRLRAEIEAAGWKVVDAGTSFRLSAAIPPDVVESGRIRYGASTSVPSRLQDPATAGATVIVRATDHADDVERVLVGLRTHAPAGTETVFVADAPSRAQAERLEGGPGASVAPVAGVDPEIIWMATRQGEAGALNAAMRRARTEVVILLDSRVEPIGDFVSPLIGALGDPTVAAVGAWGSWTTDLRRFVEAPPGDVAVVDGGVLGFRRDDVLARGPLDEAFRTGRHLETWWSLVLRDTGEGTTPRRAVRLADLPLVRHDRPDDDGFRPAERSRLDKRAFYRLVDRFGRRLDLVVGQEGTPRPIGA